MNSNDSKNVFCFHLCQFITNKGIYFASNGENKKVLRESEFTFCFFLHLTNQAQMRPPKPSKLSIQRVPFSKLLWCLIWKKVTISRWRPKARIWSCVSGGRRVKQRHGAAWSEHGMFLHWHSLIKTPWLSHPQATTRPHPGRGRRRKNKTKTKKRKRRQRTRNETSAWSPAAPFSPQCNTYGAQAAKLTAVLTTLAKSTLEVSWGS